MQLFPKTEVKNFSDCVHGEIFQYVLKKQTHVGICILEEDDRRSVLNVDSDDEESKYLLNDLQHGMDVLSYGTDWTLSTSGRLSNGEDTANDLGSIFHTANGTFMIARDSGPVGQLVLCRLDYIGVANWEVLRHRGMAHKSWRIVSYDVHQNREKNLASKENTEAT